MEEIEKKVENLNNTFKDLKTEIYRLIEEKNVNLDNLAFELGIDRVDFIDKMASKEGNYSFYLRTIDLLEKWEG